MTCTLKVVPCTGDFAGHVDQTYYTNYHHKRAIAAPQHILYRPAHRICKLDPTQKHSLNIEEGFDSERIEEAERPSATLSYWLTPFFAK